MPVVISYEDVEALGTLAFEGAKTGALAQGQMANRALGAQIEQGREATAAQLQGIQSRERIAGQQIQTQQAQFGAQQQLQYDQLAQRDALARAQMEAGMAEAGIRAQADLQQELLGAASQQERDVRLHQQRLTEIERRAQVSGTAPALGAGGVPDKAYAAQEAQQFGNLIPYDTARAVSPESAARTQQRALETAQGLSALPTSQLNNYLQSGGIGQRWAPYVQAIIQAREQVSGGASQMGAMPNGRSVPGQGGRQPQGLNQGQGLGMDERFGSLSDAELQQLGENPAMLNRFLSGP